MSVLLFAAGLVVGGLAPTMPVLIAGRALQGGLMLGVTLLALLAASGLPGRARPIGG